MFYVKHVQLSTVQSLSCVRLFATPWIVAHQASLSIPNSQSSLRFMSIESVMPSNHLIFCHPFLLSSTRQTFVGKVTSLLFSMLSRLVITFLPRSKHLLISWLQSLCAVILEPKNIKSATVSTLSPSICHVVMGLDAMTLVFECWVLSQLFHSRLSLSSRGSLVLCFLP